MIYKSRYLYGIITSSVMTPTPMSKWSKQTLVCLARASNLIYTSTIFVHQVYCILILRKYIYIDNVLKNWLQTIKVLRNNFFLLILSTYIIVEENKYRCDDNRREQHYTPRQRACKKLLDEKTNVGKFTEICAAAMAILAIAIFTGIFLFLLIMFSNLGEKW